jgi:hypothetical protein
MKDKIHLTNLVTHIAQNDFKKAYGSLTAVVNEKIKQRIVVANQKLANSK